MLRKVAKSCEKLRKNKRVVVAMSGGVDSSVTAALLKERGYEVIGITMCFNLPDFKTKRPSCCGREGIEVARRVAGLLGIRHYVLNFLRQLEDKIIQNFCSEYISGRTPNPCVRCNQYLKFGVLLKKAKLLDADFLATGHYARIAFNRRINKFLLKKAKDSNKDQSYFLYRLTQRQLRYILMPLGEYTKEEVGRFARRFNLPPADKPGSQEICFIPNNNYREFILSRFKGEIKEGDIVDTQGNILGRHRGICFYTIGQREGLGIAHKYPLYIIGIDKKHNRIIVGPREETYRDEFFVKDFNFIHSNIPPRGVVLNVKIRYNNIGKKAKVDFVNKNLLRVRVYEPVRSVTPGQSAVFYKGDVVIGGGIIT